MYLILGGFVSAENLASSLEKAWLSLHVQVFLMSYACSPCNFNSVPET